MSATDNGNIDVLTNVSDSMQFLQNEPLGPLTTIGIGGPAQYFVRASSAVQLCDALQWARRRKLPVLVLGGGSNMLIADTGWPGLVIQLGIMGLDLEEAENGCCRIIAGAGEQWDRLVQTAVEANLQGIECLSGIPGTVGASPIQNIGAYGQEVKETIEWVETIHRETRNVMKFAAADCGFDYRWSRFKGDDRDKYIVTRVSFILRKTGAPTVRYGDLTRHFEELAIEHPTLAQVREGILKIRARKGMVIDATIPDSRSCGSFFMNPVVSAEIAARVKEIAINDGLLKPEETMPAYDAKGQQVKLSAAWLMEKAGLHRGLVMGNVGLSSCHVLALINRGGGTSAEILALVDHVKQAVREKFNIDLHPEPVFVGFENTGKGSKK